MMDSSFFRFLDEARTRIRDPQVLHLRQDTPDRGSHAQSRQDLTQLGMEYRQDAQKEGHFRRRSQYR